MSSVNEVTPEAVAVVRSAVDAILKEGSKTIVALIKRQTKERHELLAGLAAKVKTAAVRLERDPTVAEDWSDTHGHLRDLSEAWSDTYESPNEEAESGYDEAGQLVLEYLDELEELLKGGGEEDDEDADEEDDTDDDE
jgi:hypothetical protein